MAKKKVFDGTFWILIGTIIALSAVVLLFRLLTRETCPPVKFSSDYVKATVGDVITFNDSTGGVKEREWDFGDNSKIATEKQVKHIYQSEGVFTVALKVNGKCTETRQISIAAKKYEPVKEDLENLTTPSIVGPTVVVVNKPVQFLGKPDNASGYQWMFGETGRIDSKSKDPIYAFRSTGTKLVTMTVNNGMSEQAVHKVFVKAEADPNANEQTSSPVNKAPGISNADLAKLIDECRNAGDDTKLKPYLCDDTSIKIKLKSGKSMTFTLFFKKLIALKETPVGNISATRDPKTNCITALTQN